MSEVIALGILGIFVMILIYTFISTWIERYKISFGHEASFILIIGLIISLVIWGMG